MKVKFLSLFLFLISLTACSPNNQNDKAVHFGIAQKPQNLDPRFASDAASEKMNNLIYSSSINLISGGATAEEAGNNYFIADSCSISCVT